MITLARTPAWQACYHPDHPHSIHFLHHGNLRLLALWLDDAWNPRRAIPTPPTIPITLIHRTEAALRQRRYPETSLG